MFGRELQQSVYLATLRSRWECKKMRERERERVDVRWNYIETYCVSINFCLTATNWMSECSIENAGWLGINWHERSPCRQTQFLPKTKLVKISIYDCRWLVPQRKSRQNREECMVSKIVFLSPLKRFYIVFT